jgi:tetratricopeptide (TPR) repeat protein
VTYYNLAIEHTEMDRHDQAVENYSEVIRLQPEHAWAYIDRGNSYYALDQYAMAVADYSMAIRFSPLNPRINAQKALTYTLWNMEAEAYARRAYAYTMLHNDSAAQQDVEKAVALGKDGAYIEYFIKTLKAKR